jgi:hypothetical protein
MLRPVLSVGSAWRAGAGREHRYRAEGLALAGLAVIKESSLIKENMLALWTSSA